MQVRRKIVVARKKRQPKTIKAIAKRVVKNQLARAVERKRLTINMDDLALGATTYYVLNPLQHVAMGTEEFQRVGDKMTNVRLQLGFQYYHVGTAPLGAQLWQGSVLRVLVFKSRRQVSTTTPAWTSKNPSDSSGFPKLFSGINQGTSQPVNTHDYTVLYDRTMKSSTPNGGGTFGIPSVMRISVPLAKSWRYADGDVYGKFNNIYVLVVAQGITGGNADTIGRLQCGGFLTWTDS